MPSLAVGALLFIEVVLLSFLLARLGADGPELTTTAVYAFSGVLYVLILAAPYSLIRGPETPRSPPSSLGSKIRLAMLTFSLTAALFLLTALVGVVAGVALTPDLRVELQPEAWRLAAASGILVALAFLLVHAALAVPAFWTEQGSGARAVARSIELVRANRWLVSKWLLGAVSLALLARVAGHTLAARAGRLTADSGASDLLVGAASAASKLVEIILLVVLVLPVVPFVQARLFRILAGAVPPSNHPDSALPVDPEPGRT